MTILTQQFRMISALLVALLVVQTAANAALIHLKDRTHVSGNLIRLGDLADFRECPEELKQRLHSLTIMPAPVSGEEKTITLEVIQRQLVLRGFNLTEIAFTGHRSVTVTTGQSSRHGLKQTGYQTDQTRQRLVMLIKNQLNSHNQQTLDLIVEILPESDYLLNRIPPRSKLSILGSMGEQSNQRMAFDVGYFDLDGQSQTIRISCVVTERPEVLALRHNLPKGQVIREQDLIRIPSVNPAEEFEDPNDVIGNETIRTVKAMTAITRDDIKRVPLIRRNEIVAVSATTGSISVRRHFRSRGEGSMGDLIPFVSLDGKQHITAQVSGLREASIDVSPNRSTQRTQTVSGGSQGISVIQKVPDQKRPPVRTVHQSPSTDQVVSNRPISLAPYQNRQQPTGGRP